MAWPDASAVRSAESNHRCSHGHPVRRSRASRLGSVRRQKAGRLAARTGDDL